MKSKISLVTIWTNNMEAMKEFYNKTLGFDVKLDLGDYVEFNNEGVRFAICMRRIMEGYSLEFLQDAKGQILELAFPCDDPEDVDITYNQLIQKGVSFIHPPENMPWNQRTALFTDPDGNIHEIFAEL
ncbi:VOC family protein [Alkaliphilus serpentinus]|uniref:Glyoxalase n=1 Tax=Alkaliphilus serpentinus TaxID=1482731 RepID=A0A833HRN8_9FIRM|nr:VOC family protein [Alkaliphilus serpentinus]KAB3533781.1 glyoxalase [Alkaliphilus serpentinus]